MTTLTKTLLLLALFLGFSLPVHAQSGSTPAFAVGVATNCSGATCTFTDNTVVGSGQYFYFLEAQYSPANPSATGQISIPSNSFNVTIPSGTGHSVTLTWTASPTAGVSYIVYRGAPPTNLH